jgi:Protein of unknown function (DUF3043)
VFRRRTQDDPAPAETESPATDSPVKQAGKGRPTPKRSEVERARRQPYTAPPKDKKAAAAQQRERRRTEQQRRMQAMRRGEEWALPAKDRGPVKALARDYVDSRRVIVSEYILFAVFALILLVFLLGAAKNSSAVLYIELGIVALIGGESMIYATLVRRLARQRFPGENTRGLTWYVAKRAIRLRSSRIPPARVARGQAI